MDKIKLLYIKPLINWNRVHINIMLIHDLLIT